MESLQPYFEGYVDADKAARILGIKLTALYSLQKGNKGPRRYRIGRRNFYKPNELAQWADEHLVKVYGEGS